MQEISFGTLYEANQKLSASEPLMVEPQKTVKWEQLKNYIATNNHFYYMLLCHELRDYTVFNLVDNTKVVANKFPVELFDCLRNRGGLVSMDLVDNDYAWEIWIRKEDNDYCYMLFPYDNGVIEI